MQGDSGNGQAPRPTATIVEGGRPGAADSPAAGAVVDDAAPPARFAAFDRLLHAQQARLTLGLSPAALGLAWADWWVHLANSPGKQMALVDKAWRKAWRLCASAARAGDADTPWCIDPLPQDHRFTAESWRQWPFNVLAQSFLSAQQWWWNATTGVPGVSRHHEAVVEFTARQLLDVVAPSNFALTNPEVLRVTAAEGGANLVRGARYLSEDLVRMGRGAPDEPDGHRVGTDVAVTPGKVVYRNRLMELIQYSPSTPAVQAEPLLFVPAWIMKYYILDLSPGNSLVRFLVGQGHTVFMISWKNPGPEDRDVSFDDYRTLGIGEALDAIARIMPHRPVHAAGYCLGGTLLTIAAAAMARDGDERLRSVTLFAAQTDFADAGELSLFIDESQVTYLADLMWDQGYLDGSQMAGAFMLLRSADLLWSRAIGDYLLGRRSHPSDLMAWNADSTRLPARMHTEYLTSLFLRNDLFEGRYQVDGRPVALSDIRVPMFVVATTTDHVAPWTSVYKLMLAADTEVTFLLTTGGHNAGVISEPGHPGRSYQVARRFEGDPYIDPERWRRTTPESAGSWWPEWHGWLTDRSTGPVPPPPMGPAGPGGRGLGEAPGTYVRMR